MTDVTNTAAETEVTPYVIPEGVYDMLHEIAMDAAARLGILDVPGFKLGTVRIAVDNLDDGSGIGVDDKGDYAVVDEEDEVVATNLPDDDFDDTELDFVGFEVGDVINRKTWEGTDSQAFPLIVTEEYGINPDADPVKIITRKVSNGEGLESGSINVIATDSDGTRFIESVTDLDGNSIAAEGYEAEGDNDEDEAAA